VFSLCLAGYLVELHVYFEVVLVGVGVDHHAAVVYGVYCDFDGCREGEEEGEVGQLAVHY